MGILFEFLKSTAPFVGNAVNYENDYYPPNHDLSPLATARMSTPFSSNNRHLPRGRNWVCVWIYVVKFYNRKGGVVGEVEQRVAH